MKTAEASVLYDAPGPRARRLTVVTSVVVGALLAYALYAWVYQPLADKGQFTHEKWGALVDPSDENFPLVWQRLGIGFRNTLTAAALSIVASVVLGTALAVLRFRLADVARGPRPRLGAAGRRPAFGRVPVVLRYWCERALGLVTRVFVEFFRGIPVLITIFFTARILPEYGVRLSPLYFLVIGLTLYNMVVIGEILRSGMANLPRGQKEAADAIGLSPLQTIVSILLPQSYRVMLPALISQVVVVLKDTSLGFVISYEEVLRIGGQIIQSLSNPIQVYIVIAVIYILINYLISRLAVYVQRRVARGRKTPPGAVVPRVAVPDTAPGVGAAV
ncbi:MAG: glutamate transport system permease protein [Actinomycetota bacterium]|jgi:glutamate transport system permease protein|nr:glutamate transport system permease protein [Actinomycetota bacterium]